MRFYVYIHKEKWEWEGIHHASESEARGVAHKAVQNGADEAQVFQLVCTTRRDIITQDAGRGGK